MIRTLAFSLVATLLVQPVAALERPALRAEATVTSNIVRIGDLVENAGIVADVPIFRAPALGETGSVPVAQALEALRAHSLVGLDPGAITEITVTRASRAITPHEIEAALASAVAKAGGAIPAADIAISFDRALRTIRVEPSVTAMPRIEHLRYEARSGRFEADLDIPGAPAARRHLAGTAVATVETVTVSRPLSRGEIIKIGDLAMQRVPRDQIGADSVTDPDQAIGLAVRNPIVSGRVLRGTDLMKPELVQRGENVTLIYQAPGIMLAVRGKAADSGAEGDMIDVVNTQSNRTVRGTIIGPGQVAVAALTPRVINTADASSQGYSQSRAGEK